MPAAEGAIPVYIPQTRRTPEPFHSTLLPFLRQNTEALNRLVLEMHARGLSTRDIEDTFRDPKTQECLLSRTAVSQLTMTCGRSMRPSLSAIFPGSMPCICSWAPSMNRDGVLVCGRVFCASGPSSRTVARCSFTWC